MRVPTEPPKLIGKCKYSAWQVRVDYFDGRSDIKNYFAFSSSEALRHYLQENGVVKNGLVSVKCIDK